MTCAGKSSVHPRNLWVQGSNLTGGSQTAKLPSFGGYSLKFKSKPYYPVHLYLDIWTNNIIKYSTN